MRYIVIPMLKRGTSESRWGEVGGGDGNRELTVLPTVEVENRGTRKGVLKAKSR